MNQSATHELKKNVKCKKVLFIDTISKIDAIFGDKKKGDAMVLKIKKWKKKQNGKPYSYVTLFGCVSRSIKIVLI